MDNKKIMSKREAQESKAEREFRIERDRRQAGRDYANNLIESKEKTGICPVLLWVNNQ